MYVALEEGSFGSVILEEGRKNYVCDFGKR
jgi:hypothetical protein